MNIDTSSLTHILKDRFGGSFYTARAKTYAAMCAYVERLRGPWRDKKPTSKWLQRIGVRIKKETLESIWNKDAPLLALISKGPEAAKKYERRFYEHDVKDTQGRRGAVY